MENQKREVGREEEGDPYNEENGEQVRMVDVKIFRNFQTRMS